MKNILLVEPKRSKKYHTTYPPLGLLKLSSYHKKRKDKVRLVSGFVDDGFKPDIIYITSLFTYAYEPVHDVINYYREKYKKAKIIVGGIYATLCPDHLKERFKDRIEIYRGLIDEVEDILPDYKLVPDCDSTILFSSRGCVRNCSFCSVPRIEPKFIPKKSIKHLIYPGHKKIILWDNNILASPYWENIFDELKEVNLTVDFNQGLDARLLTEKVAMRLKELKIPIVRLAYDTNSVRNAIKKAIDLLSDIGIRKRRILVYSLYNFSDNPEDFLNRIKDILEWGVVAYPMRYEPITPMPKNSYVSKNWTKEELEMIAKARRVIGYGGAFPPYEGLRKKILNAKNFKKAFELRPPLL
ncbi:MAG: hypothetical protein JRI44_13525 [Deltaproteobacteria bacterium]|nr:hypothetical protein [Deltaproteobacteria bacterium]